MQTRRLHRLALLSMAALAALMVGCGKKPSGASGACCPAAKAAPTQGVQVAVVAGADMLVQIDIAAMRKTPIMQAIKAKREAGGKTAPGKLDEETWAKIQAATGLSEEDFLSVLLSADLDTVNLDNPKAGDEVRSAMGACAIALARPLPFPKLYECMTVLSARSKGATLEQIELAGRPVARVLPASPNEPVVHAAVSLVEDTLLLAFNAPAMEGMLARDRANEAGHTPPDLAQLSAKVESGTQLRALVLVSDAMRTRIQARIDASKDPKPQEQQTKAGMMVAFFNPMRNIRNLVFGAKAGDELAMRLAGDLANAAEAQQCAQLLRAFVVPMVIKSFENTDPDNKMQVDDSLEADSDGATLRLKLKVTAQDVANWQAAGK